LVFLDKKWDFAPPEIFFSFCPLLKSVPGTPLAIFIQNRVDLAHREEVLTAPLDIGLGKLTFEKSNFEISVLGLVCIISDMRIC